MTPAQRRWALAAALTLTSIVATAVAATARRERDAAMRLLAESDEQMTIACRLAREAGRAEARDGLADYYPEWAQNIYRRTP